MSIVNPQGQGQRPADRIREAQAVKVIQRIPLTPHPFLGWLTAPGLARLAAINDLPGGD